MTLQSFLCANPVDNLRKNILIGERFKDENDKAFLFEIRALSSREIFEIRKKAEGRKDEGYFNILVCLEGCVNPNFKNAEDIEKCGCILPEQYINKVLTAGEIQRLVSQIMKLSGFDESIEELTGKVKN